ncbi:MAG TPA: hypothetical protein VGJ93_01255 [Desulfuromonadaceae bacterium]|jgi:hypothetical protein
MVLCLLSLCQVGLASTDSVSSATGPRIAIFPLENLSGGPAPLKELDQELSRVVRQYGILLTEPGSVEGFIESNQIRYLGGIDERTAALLSEKTGADAVLISTLELYSDVSPPKFSLICRLVSLKGLPEIIWMDSVGIAGDDQPGFLGLGLINDLKILRAKGLVAIAGSLKGFITSPPPRRRLLSSGRKEEEPFSILNLIRGIKKEKPLLNQQLGLMRTGDQAEKPYTVEDLLQKMKAQGGLFLSRYSPRDWYSSQDMLVNQEKTIAIIPFFNRSTRKHAAELQVLHLAKQLVLDGSFRVLELGVIRDKMLSMHVIMTDGISIPSMDLITISLGVDLLLNGLIFDYLDTVGYGSYPKIDFSMQMYERESKKILWSSHSHNQGDDGVFFFDYGRIATTGALADKMCRALVLKLVENAR